MPVEGRLTKIRQCISSPLLGGAVVYCDAGVDREPALGHRESIAANLFAAVPTPTEIAQGALALRK